MLLKNANSRTSKSLTSNQMQAMLSQPVDIKVFKVRADGNLYALTAQIKHCDAAGDCSTINSQTCNQIKPSCGVRRLYITTQVSGKTGVVVADMTYRFNTPVSKHCQGWYPHLTGNREHTDPVIDTHMKQIARSTWSSTQTSWMQRAEPCGSMWRGAPGNYR